MKLAGKFKFPKYWVVGCMTTLLLGLSTTTVLPLIGSEDEENAPEATSVNPENSYSQGKLAASEHNYQLAEQQFLNALEVLERNPEWRRQVYFDLFAIYSQQKQLKKMQELAERFNREYPQGFEQDKELWQIEILIAENRYKEAEEKLDAVLLTPTSGDDYLYWLNLQALIKMKLGKYTEAYKNYTLLVNLTASDVEWNFDATYRQIYAALQAGMLPEARELLKGARQSWQSERELISLELLSLLELLKSQKLPEFNARYSDVVSKLPSKVDAFRYELDYLASEYYLSSPTPQMAVVFLKDAFKVAPEDSLRRNCGQKLIELLLNGNDKNAALEVLDKYLELFYDEKEGVNLLWQQSRLFFELSENDRAVAAYNRLLQDKRLTPELRREVLKEFALSSEKMQRNREEVIKLYSELENSATETIGREEIQLLLGEYFYRQGSYDEACQILEPLSKVEAVAIAREAGYWQMEALCRLEQWEKAALIHQQLIKEPLPDNLASGLLLSGALISDKLKQYKDAIKNYLLFAERYPKHSEAAPGALRAGRLEFADSEYNKAAEAYELALKLAEANSQPNLAAEALYRLAVTCDAMDDQERFRLSIQESSSKYPESNHTLAVRWYEIDALRSGVDRDAVLSRLRELAVFAQKHRPELLPMVRLEQGRELLKYNRNDEALNVFDELVKNYPSTPEAAQALFASANILAAKNLLNEALKAYQNTVKAATKADQNRLKWCAIGRIGDLNYELYFANASNGIYLREALRAYDELLQTPDLSPDLRAQSLYKQAKCLRLSGDETGAVEALQKLMLQAKEEYISEGRVAAPGWTSKGARELLHLYLERKRGADALRLVELVQELNLPTGGDYSQLVEAIHRRYSL